MKTKFDSPYDAGYDAGMFGGNNFNSHYSFFNTREKMREWQRGNDLGSAKRETQRREDTAHRIKAAKQALKSNKEVTE